MFSVHSAVTRETPSGLLLEIVKGTPIRFLYRDGAIVERFAGTIAELRRTATVEGTAVRAVNETVVRALPDRAFRWDPVEQLWVMNLDTCGLRSRHTHSYQVTLADGSTITFRFGLR